MTTFKILIDAKFGSDFQEETARDSLKVMIKGWSAFYELNHSKNLISYQIEEEK